MRVKGNPVNQLGTQPAGVRRGYKLPAKLVGYLPLNILDGGSIPPISTV